MSNDQRWEFYLAGVKFHEAHTVIGELETGMELLMRPEPENKWDSSAVAITSTKTIKTAAVAEDIEEETMLGYVPAKMSSMVSAFLVTNENPVCTITELNKDDKPWKWIKVVVEEGKVEEEEVHTED